jgi:YidC/Oxa1 family membrane protein insertase
MYPLAKMADMDIRIRETHIDYVTTDEDFVDNKVDIDPEDFPQGTTEAVNLFSVSNKFFAMLIQTDSAFGSGVKFTNTQKISDSNENEVVAFGANAYYKEFTLSPNSTKEFSYKAYSGIKNKAIFEELNDEAGRVMHLSSFAPLAFLSSKLLDALEFFKNIFGSYGISIILLTIIVRLIFWPITAKGTESMKKMQVIQPMIKEIQEKYKDDRQMASMKVMELYKEHKVNPVGGCIPMLIQIPIFMSFYWGIDGAANLRHQSFMWASDLTQPDLVAHILGLPIHPLVLLMTGLMVLQQKLTPTTGDPAQKNMMMVMPLVLLFVMYGMPAGLTLYWTTSNIMSIIQLVTTQKLKQTN